MNKNHRLKEINFKLLFATVLFSLIGEPSIAEESNDSSKVAILAGGCFWCLEKDFDGLAGVVSTTSGYSGGSRENPTYKNYNKEAVGIIPHVEVVQIAYDSSKISYKQILEFYFRHIDPLDDGGQFCDRGAAYRPVIYVANEQERSISEDVIAEVQKIIGQEIKVTIEESTKFWPAEKYHQKYYKKKPLRYKFYRYRCGRDSRVKEVWENK